MKKINVYDFTQVQRTNIGTMITEKVQECNYRKMSYKFPFVIIRNKKKELL